MGRVRRKRQAALRERLAESQKQRTPVAATTVSWQPWVCTAALVIATTVALHPVLRAEFLSWDDTAYVSMSKLLQTPDGLRRIWNPFEPTRERSVVLRDEVPRAGRSRARLRQVGFRRRPAAACARRARMAAGSGAHCPVPRT